MGHSEGSGPDLSGEDHTPVSAWDKKQESTCPSMPKGWCPTRRGDGRVNARKPDLAHWYPATL
jgi:hypothetical protein